MVLQQGQKVHGRGRVRSQELPRVLCQEGFAQVQEIWNRNLGRGGGGRGDGEGAPEPKAGLGGAADEASNRRRLKQEEQGGSDKKSDLVGVRAVRNREGQRPQ